MEFPATQIVSELERCRVRWQELAVDEHSSWLHRWLESYKEFYAPERRRLRGARAIAQAQKLCSGSFLLVPCRKPSSKGWKAVGTAYRCEGEILPDLTQVSHFVDVFISPEDLSWTLLYGHEVDVFGGPDFSRADWFSAASTERA
jgi:hypothetical protein